MTKQEPAKRLGVFSLWLFIRIIEYAAWFIIVPTAYDYAMNLQFPDISVLGGTIIVIGINIRARFNAYGTADDSGVTYRHYFRQRFVGWADIEHIEWNPGDYGGFALKLMKPRSFNRLSFHINPQVKDAIAQVRTGQVPPIVEWVKAKVEAAQGTGS